MKKSFLVLALIFSISLIVTSCKDSKKDVETEEQTELGVEKADLALNDAYQCSMDCEHGKIYDKESPCPVCKMTMQKVEKEEEKIEANHDEHDHD